MAMCIWIDIAIHIWYVCMRSESCSVVSDPMDYTVHGISRPEYWSGELFPSPPDLPNPGIEPRSPTLQADSLPAEPQGKLNIYVWSFHTYMNSMFSIVNWLHQIGYTNLQSHQQCRRVPFLHTLSSIYCLLLLSSIFWNGLRSIV